MADHTRNLLGLEVLETTSSIVKMEDHWRIQLVGLIKLGHVLVVGFKYLMTFMVLRMEGNDGRYPMLLGRSLLWMAKVKHN